MVGATLRQILLLVLIVVSKDPTFYKLKCFFYNPEHSDHADGGNEGKRGANTNFPYSKLWYHLRPG